MKYEPIPFIDKLYFHVYTIGYKNQGESIVFLIENDYGIAYSGVIDVFEENGNNETIEILKNNNVENINFFCWTHPHLDHSLGIDKIFNNYINDESKIILPDNIYKMCYDYDDKSISESMNYIIENFISQKRIKPKIYPVKGNVRVEQLYIGNGVRNSKCKYKFDIETIAPAIETVEKRFLQDRIYTLNDFSVALVINFGEVNYLFGGDIQDSTIRKIEQFSIPNKIDYLKIPHHCSKGSLEILKWFEGSEASGIACTTEYSSSHLPDFESLDKYKQHFSTIFSTKGLEIQRYNLGVIHTVYDVTKDLFYTDLEGNGIKYYDILDINKSIKKEL